MHYVCPKCAGVAQEPGVCQTEGCEHKGQPLQPCSCNDGTHEEVLNSEKTESSET